MTDLHAQLSEHRVYVCEDLSLETERIRHLSRGDLRHIDVSPRTIILFVKEELPP
jgi:precorrin-6B methylase 1